MEEKPKKDVLQPVTDETRVSARALLAAANSASLGTLDPTTGHPMCSRTGLMLDENGSPIFLISHISAHYRALVNDQRASMLVGEPGTGDPLSHQRITVVGQAEQITDDAEHQKMREAYLAYHPKAKIYVDLPGFAFWRLQPERANYAQGFGKAYALAATDLQPA